MTQKEPLSDDQQSIRSTYVPIFQDWLIDELGDSGKTIQFDHVQENGKITGFEWNTTDGTSQGEVGLGTLDSYMNRYTVTYHGGVKHGEFQQGEGEPSPSVVHEIIDHPSIYNNHTLSSESTHYELRIVDGRYEYHAVQSWDGSPPRDFEHPPKGDQ